MDKKIIILFSLLIVLICFYSFPQKVNVEELPNTDIEEPSLETIPKIENAIYLTGPYLTSEYRFEKIFSLMEETEINAVVIDVKDFSG
ncbi:MAG: putative glycoside hydrolase, partial [Candidatus Pacebacteria bacterium]|nr:putative glycoside hydrolase [Candidatus Paceibacterota bacterium]